MTSLLILSDDRGFVGSAARNPRVTERMEQLATRYTKDGRCQLELYVLGMFPTPDPFDAMFGGTSYLSLHAVAFPMNTHVIVPSIAHGSPDASMHALAIRCAMQAGPGPGPDIVTQWTDMPEAFMSTFANCGWTPEKIKQWRL